jgi:Family of unknown function (DUF6364)
MKTRLNLTIDETLLTSMKQYASKEQTSVSELVENYFTMLTKPKKKKSIIDLVESLNPSTKIAKDADLKDLFYKDQAKKHGF